MEPMRRLSSKVFGRQIGAVLLAVALAGPAAAQLSPAARSLYANRLAANDAGQFGGYAGSPLVGVAGVPTLDSVVTWDRLRRETYTATFAEYALFLRNHPGWPQTLTIRRQAEKTITESVAAADRLAYFKTFPPLSALAKLRLAEAHKAQGHNAEARTAARDAWDSAGLDEAAEAALLAQFAGDLTQADHVGRADRLLWSGQITAAGRLLSRLEIDRRLWALARIALRANSPDASNRLAAVPASLRDEPGLMLDRANWLRRRGDLATAQALLGNPAMGPVLDPEAWLKARLDFARQAWRAGSFETAYRIASRHAAFPQGRPVAERSLGERQAFIDSEWLAGWLALRKLGRAEAAVGHFKNVRAAALTPLSQSRGDYWTGRAAEAAGRERDAKTAFEAAAAHFDYFYGQLAAERLGKPLAIRRNAAPEISADAASTFRADPLVRAAVALGDLGDHDRQTIFLKTLADRAKGAREQALVAGLAVPLGRLDAGVYAGKAARSGGELGLLDEAFPVLTLPASLNSSWTMIHALTRQESQFDRKVVSPANARGLMQLLPGTAAEQAEKLGLQPSTARLTSDPTFNVTLGSGYFNRLKDNFSGSHVLAVAGYNAGPGNARKFIAANGDPRAGIDVVDWIEAIPLSETRNYVQRVLENAVVYDMLHPSTATMPPTNRLTAYLGKRSPG